MNNSTATTVLATQKVFTLNHPKYLKSNRYRSIDNMEIEEVKNEFASMASLTPVARLQIFLNRRNIKDFYELVERGGVHHAPVFKYRMYFNNKEAIGAGASKQEAKQNSALVMIKKLSGERVDEIVVSSSHKATQIKPVIENPVGWLQEMCTKRHWKLPKYEEMKICGSPYFQYTCSLYEHQESGDGATKKIAKRKAADAMWKSINNEPSWARKFDSYALGPSKTSS